MMVIEWPRWAMYTTLGFLSAAAEAYVDAFLPTHLDMRLILGFFWRLKISNAQGIRFCSPRHSISGLLHCHWLGRLSF